MNLDALSAYLTTARWFAGKGRSGRLSAVTALDWYGGDVAGVRVRSEIARVDYPGGDHELYQLLISYRDTVIEGAVVLGEEVDSLGIPHDATTDPEAMAVYLAALTAQADTATWAATLYRPEAVTGAVRTFAGEQSNTSLIVGDQAMVKIFRRLEPGKNLDIAVHDALSRAGVKVAAELFGWVEGRLPEGCDLAMVVELLADAKDGWELATRSARTGSDFSTQAGKIGAALAQIHHALADTFPASKVAAAEVASVMDRRLQAAITIVPDLLEYAEGLRRRFRALATVGSINVQRTHGDFHLGQTLSTPGGWRIIDFEGEPLKTLAERELPDSKWRDVAGMVRSLGYAAATAEHDTGDADASQRWASRAVDAFLAGYSASLSESQHIVLSAYIADKAIYESVYETRNRPSWTPIPLRAIAALTQED